MYTSSPGDVIVNVSDSKYLATGDTVIVSGMKTVRGVFTIGDINGKEMTLQLPNWKMILFQLVHHPIITVRQLWGWYVH